MMIAHLSQPQPNMSSIGEGCDSLGKTIRTSHVGNLEATYGFRVNLYSGEGGLISFPLLLLKGNAILPMAPKADCDYSISILYIFDSKKHIEQKQNGKV